MLAIVIPVILATLGVAFWFRASNERARYRPNFAYSGRLEMLVWSIPAMTVFLVGGVAWVGSHDVSPRKPIASTVKALQGPGRLARLEMAVHLSRPRRRERQSTDHSRWHAGQLRADLLGRDEQLLRAAARQPDLHHGGNGHPSSSAGRPSRNVPRNVCAVQRRGLFRHAFQRRCGDRPRSSRSGLIQRAAPVRSSTRRHMRIWPSRALRSRHSPIARSRPICSTASWSPKCSPTMQCAAAIRHQ